MNASGGSDGGISGGLEDVLGRMELEFAVNLPREYREAITDFPLTGDGQEPLLFENPDSIHAINRRYREEGFRGCLWPPELFVIGGNSVGDVYFLDLSREISPVFAVTYDMEGFDPAAIDRLIQSASFSQWVEELSLGQDWFREVQERRRGKKWWQFWI